MEDAVSPILDPAARRAKRKPRRGRDSREGLGSAYWVGAFFVFLDLEDFALAPSLSLPLVDEVVAGEAGAAL